MTSSSKCYGEENVLTNSRVWSASHTPVCEVSHSQAQRTQNEFQKFCGKWLTDLLRLMGPFLALGNYEACRNICICMVHPCTCTVA